MNQNKILRNILLGGIFLLPALTPWIVAGNLFFPFITGKAYFFRILTEILFGVWLILMYRDPVYRPRWSLVMWAVAAFIGITLLANLFGANPYRSFWSNYERMEGFITLAHIFAYFIVAGAVVTGEKLWYWFFGVSIGASLLMDIFAFLQLAGELPINQGGVRVDGKLGNAAYLAMYNLFHIFLAAFLLLRAPALNLLKAWKEKNGAHFLFGSLCLVAVVCNTIILYHTATRGAILGLIAGSIVSLVLVAVFEKKNKKLARGSMWAIVVILALVLSFVLFKDASFVRESPVLSRFASISLSETTTKSRFMVWDMAWQGFKEHPILGWGQENFIVVFSKYYDPLMYEQEPWFDRAHNVVLDWLVAGGLLGALSYFFLFVSALYLLWSKSKTFSIVEKSVLSGLFVAYFSHNLFVFDNLVSYILFFSVLAYIHSESVESHGIVALEEKVVVLVRRVKGFFPRYSVAPLVVVLTVFSMYFFNYPSMAANVNLINGLENQKEGPAKNLSYLEKALSYHSFGGTEIAERFSITAYSVLISDKVDDQTKQTFYNDARSALVAQTDQDPNNVRILLFLGTFLDQAGKYDEALVYLERAYALAPKKQAVLFELGNAYIGKKDISNALSVLKTAYDLASDYREARLYYAAAAIHNKDNALADELLAPLADLGPVNDPRIINAYFATGQYGEMIAIYQKLIEKNPDDPQAYLLLASAYLQNSERTKAIVEIQKVINMRPDFKGQGEYYIGEIRAGRNP